MSVNKLLKTHPMKMASSKLKQYSINRLIVDRAASDKHLVR
ncbi:hypothetical protein S2091_3028 [Solimicrobium silvestre]|uniref:Uncharacterized protein n=1 Tax=Solimicrobium silvestre TaxID=2099400 RepID=A0A2S9GXC8_9BURK|nr:hypothetical protein S2091_3028 [Solimicrobium silvestre]